MIDFQLPRIPSGALLVIHVISLLFIVLAFRAKPDRSHRLLIAGFGLLAAHIALTYLFDAAQLFGAAAFRTFDGISTGLLLAATVTLLLAARSAALERSLRLIAIGSMLALAWLAYTHLRRTIGTFFEDTGTHLIVASAVSVVALGFITWAAAGASGSTRLFALALAVEHVDSSARRVQLALAHHGVIHSSIYPPAVALSASTIAIVFYVFATSKRNGAWLRLLTAGLLISALPFAYGELNEGLSCGWGSEPCASVQIRPVQVPPLGSRPSAPGVHVLTAAPSPST